jgi:putative oxidoreductase
MKIATLIVRLLIGALLLFASISYFLKLVPEPVTTGDFKAFQIGLVASTYLMPLAKAIELLCGLSFISNKFVSLSNLVILPITLNILFINYFMMPEGLPIAIGLLLGNLFLIYSKWENYKSVFKV